MLRPVAREVCRPFCRSFWPYIHDACKGLSQVCSNPEVRRQAQHILSTMRELNRSALHCFASVNTSAWHRRGLL